ncbi:MAG: hypothetical protein ACO3UU_08365, partial [Minisyncoccia bacterium]
QGIDTQNLKPVSWTKQKKDKVINGYFVSKSRLSIEPQIYPTSKIIKSFDSDDSEIFVDSIDLFNYESVPLNEIDFDILIVSGSDDPVSAAVTAIVSIAGTVQSLSINNAGSGYTGSSINVSISAPPIIGVGVGTVATATISIVNGSLSTATITNPGFGYNSENPPQVLVPLPDPVYEKITRITGIEGQSGNIIGIGTTVGIGTDLAINFKLPSVSGLSTGNPIYVFNTKVGTGVTSILNSNSNVVGIGTTFLDNIYYISGINASVGIITCNIHSQSSVVGIATTGNIVGQFSWGRLYQKSGQGFIRSSSPISIGVSGFTVNSGLNTFPTVQRRGYGLKGIGPIQNIL